MSKKRLTPSDLKQAKQLYMNHVPVAEIARRFDVARQSINRYVLGDGGWKEERDLMSAELVQNLAESRRPDFAKMTGSTITVLKRALQDLAHRDEPPTILEAKGAAQILETLDKITRLDEGNPTDIIHSEKPVTVVELRKRLSKDPFAEELEEADYAEIPEKTD